MRLFMLSAIGLFLKKMMKNVDPKLIENRKIQEYLDNLDAGQRPGAFFRCAVQVT